MLGEPGRGSGPQGAWACDEISRSAAGSVEGRPGKASGVCDVCDRRVSQRRPLRRGRKQTFFSTSGDGQLDAHGRDVSLSPSSHAMISSRELAD